MRNVAHSVMKLDASLQALENLRATRNPLDSEAAHYVKVSKQAQRLKQNVEAIANTIAQYQQKEVIDLDTKIRTTLGMADSPYAQEIRSALRQMSPKDRNTAINQMIQDKDGVGIQAVVSAPGLLSGIAEDIKRGYHENYTHRYAADLMAEQNKVVNMAADVATLVGNARRAAESALDPVVLAQIDAAQAASDAAQASFNASLSDE